MRQASPWLPAAVALASTLLVLAVAAAPRRTDRVAAVFPPWWSQAGVAAAAARAGDIDTAGGWRNVLIVRSDQPGLSHRLRAAGAWLLLDADLARACLANPIPGARS